MRWPPLLLALALFACAGQSQPPMRGEVAFRVILEKENPTYCVQGPDFAVATTEDRWIDVFDRETDCQPQQSIDLPEVDFGREIGLVAWWKVEGCQGFQVRTDSIERVGSEVVVHASAWGPPQGTVCATARGALESFLAVERSNLFTGSETVRFVLNGSTIGKEKAPH